jgi:hypothetical protein
VVTERDQPRMLQGCGQVFYEGREPDFLPAALTFAHRTLCAAAIFLRPAAEMVRFFRVVA